MNTAAKPKFYIPESTINELFALFIIIVGAFLALSIFSYNAGDPGLFNKISGADVTIHNLCGKVGAYVADVLLQYFGFASILISLAVLFAGFAAFLKSDTHMVFPRVVFMSIAALTLSGILGIFGSYNFSFQMLVGGYIGFAIWQLVSSSAYKAALLAIMTIICFLSSIVAFTASTNFERRFTEKTKAIWDTFLKITMLSQVYDLIIAKLFNLFYEIFSFIFRFIYNIIKLALFGAGDKKKEAVTGNHVSFEKKPFATDLRDDEAYALSSPGDENIPFDQDDESVEGNALEFFNNIPKAAPVASRLRKPVDIIESEKLVRSPVASYEKFVLPDTGLLKDYSAANDQLKPDKSKLFERVQELENVLTDFGVKGKIINVYCGPIVTLFELRPDPGTKSSRVVGLADDIARSMSAISTRIAVISGKNAIGIEIPNQKRQIVYLRDILESENYLGGEDVSVPLAIGKDIAGLPVVVDLAKMPHLLVAGTTGSGKSVGINAMILSLLYKFTPEECKFVMIDPKMLELSVYDGIPHLITPVVTNSKKAILTLRWVVNEMEKRYKVMSSLGVRNLIGYNQKIEQSLKYGESLYRTVHTSFDEKTQQAVVEKIPIETKKMPYIVVIVDEMADLMLTSGKEVESSIQRLAQMARAAGIHIIMATQRPSVDVVTGVIKANFPTRISFQVTSKIDSRTILGTQGGEQLLGQGDMLFMGNGGKITRVHAPFVSDGEVESVVNFLKHQGKPEYEDELRKMFMEVDGGAFTGGTGNEAVNIVDFESDVEFDSMDGEDGLYNSALRIITEEGKISISYLQRRLKVGYNKAASLIERMEEEGIISAPNRSGKRMMIKGESDNMEE